MSKVILLVGPPGVGKSTWIKNYVKDIPTPYTVCSADTYFTKDGIYTFNPVAIGQAHQTCYEKFVNALSIDIPLIFIDNTNIAKDHRSKYINKALEYDYDVSVKVFDVSDIEKIKQQNKSDERVKSNKLIPDHVIERMAKQMDIEHGNWRAEKDNRTYKLTKVLEANEFIRKNSVHESSLLTKDFAKDTDIKEDNKPSPEFKKKCNDLMLNAMELKEKISLLQTGITEKEKIEPLDDAYAACELVVHHMEDLIQES